MSVNSTIHSPPTPRTPSRSHGSQGCVCMGVADKSRRPRVRRRNCKSRKRLSNKFPELKPPSSFPLRRAACASSSKMRSQGSAARSVFRLPSNRAHSRLISKSGLAASATDASISFFSPSGWYRKPLSQRGTSRPPFSRSSSCHCFRRPAGTKIKARLTPRPHRRRRRTRIASRVLPMPTWSHSSLPAGKARAVSSTTWC